MKVVEFPKVSIKIKVFKIFYKARTVSLFNPLPNKGFLRLWNKNIFMEIYRNIQTFAFQLLRECSSWVSKNGAVQMFFLKPTRNMFDGKFVNRVRFLAVLWEHIFYNAE